MSSKYIHNISGEDRTYQGIEISNSSFYQIPDSLLIEFQNEPNLLTDLLSGDIRMSRDGITDYSTTPIINHNFLRNEHYEVDSEGRQINRIAAAKSGWTYLADTFEVETSKVGSLYCKDYLGTSCPGTTVKFYKEDGTEITTQEDLDLYCVRTEVLFKPNFDYEIVSGNIHQHAVPASDVRIWVVGGIIELGGAFVKEMVRGLNMKFVGTDDHIRTDGRASKYMKKDIVGVPYQGNQLKFIFKHDAGYKHKIMMVLEFFRA